MPPDTLKQRTQTVTTPDGDIVVHRMRSKKAREFLKKLATHFGALKDILLAAQKTKADTTGGAADAFLALILPKLVELIVSVEELSEHLLVHSTELDAAKIDELEFGDWLELIRVALTLNCGDDLKKSCVGIAETLGGLMTTTPSGAASGATS